VKPEQLPAALQRSLAPVYLIGGAEPLLAQECRDQIIEAAQREGFAERKVFEVVKGFDWNLLAEDSATMSLFSSRKITDVRLPTGRPGRDGAKAFADWLENPDPDVLLIVSCGKWETSIRKAKWAAKLARAGVLVEIWPIRPRELPGWIAARMRRAGLQAEPEAIAMLADLAEGNLLAAQQEIDKLLLLGGGGRVTADDIARSAANSSRFDAFRLVECALSGQLAECLRVASGLRRTDVPIQVVSVVMFREIQLLEQVRLAIRSGDNERSVFGRFRVWPARQQPIRRALDRLSGRQIQDALILLARIDRQGKGQAAGDPWQSLDLLLWRLCDPATARTA
jgi:DNA polymerase-3 subunit delta